ncbi:MAG: hypothetical protein ACXWB0_04935 [Sulfuricurvum sp.]
MKSVFKSQLLGFYSFGTHAVIRSISTCVLAAKTDVFVLVRNISD